VNEKSAKFEVIKTPKCFKNTEKFIYYLSLYSDNMNNAEIDTLFDKVETQLKTIAALLESPRYASDRDFINPYFVVVHENQIPIEMGAKNVDPDLGTRVLQEISEIKTRHPNSWTKGSPFLVPSEVPRGRPVLVCGAFEEVCVGQQYHKLIQAGYDAYISREGILSFFSLK